jgi:hypothetical protein
MADGSRSAYQCGDGADDWENDRFGSYSAADEHEKRSSIDFSYLVSITFDDDDYDHDHDDEERRHAMESWSRRAGAAWERQVVAVWDDDVSS